MPTTADALARATDALAAAFDGGTPAPTSAEVQAERGNASAALVSGWLSVRLGIRSRVVESDGPGLTAVEVRFEGGERLRIDLALLPFSTGLDALLASRTIAPVTFRDWRKIEAAEVAAALDGNPREKFTSVEAMLAAIGR